jgi:signal transduction histidine kinase
VEYVFFCFFVVAVLIKLANLYCLIRGVLTVTYPQITAMQERLKEENRLAALGAISAAIEHDMKTPLASMSTKLETMKHLYQDNRIRLFIDKLEVDKSRIAAIARIIPYMRGGDEYYDRDRFMGKVSITQVVNLAIKLVKNELELDPQKYFFRNRNKDHFVRAYSPMLQQVIVNILKNGIEAIIDAGKDGGGITIKIYAVREVPKDAVATTTLKPYTKWIQVDIEDNGCGIVKENISKLTTLFTTKLDRKANSGVGLFMASRIIRIHDGTMRIRSTENKGTTVSLFLPEWQAYQALIGEMAAQLKPKTSISDSQLEVILPDLLEDDNPRHTTPNEA